LTELLKVLVSKLKDATIEWNGIKVRNSDIEDIVRQREILKIMLAVAISDNDPDPKELDYIAKASSKLEGKLDVLQSEDKFAIISAALGLATVDGKFKDEEYDVILSKAIGYEISVADFNDLVKQTCRKAGIKKLPSQIV